VHATENRTMVMWRRLAAVALSVAVLSTCRVDAQTDGGVLRLGTIIEPGTLNPAIGTLVGESNLAALLYDGLVRIDHHGNPVPDLALEVPSRANGGISADGKTLTYHLARNARWHDGKPVTADDVVFTYHAIMNPQNNVGNRFGYKEIAAVTSPDPFTVRVRFNAVYAPAIYLFGDNNQGAILPKHLLEHYADLNHVPFNRKPIGSGPYRLREWRSGDRLIFDANPMYFRGPPTIARIEERIIPDTNTLLTQLRTHEIDFTNDLDPGQLAQVKGFKGVATEIISTNGYRHVAFNTRRPPLDDVRVRRALCYAFDPDVIYRKIYFGIGDRAPADQNPSTGWANPKLRYYPFDPTRAAALLEEAGWSTGPGGIRVRAGRRLSIQIVTVSGARANEAVEVMLQNAWRNIGVDATIKNFPGTTLFAPIQSGGVLQSGRYDVALFSFIRNPDPSDQALIGPSSIPPAGLNVSFYANPEVGRLQIAGLRTFDRDARHVIYNRIQAIIVRDVPIYTLLWVPFVTGYTSRLQGLATAPNGVAFWNVLDWRLKPE
jgi:peptide/nickel transport system substrate-binding protein